MNRRIALFATVTLALVLSAAPLTAQLSATTSGGSQGKPPKPPKSDNNGHGHGSDMIAGGTSILAANGARAASISSAQLQVMHNLAPINVASTNASPSATVATVVAGGAGLEGSMTALESSLAPSGVDQKTIAELVRNIENLGTVPVNDGGKAAEARIRQAARNFNAFVSGASVAFLANPPAEFQAMRQALAPLVLALDSRTAR